MCSKGFDDPCDAVWPAGCLQDRLCASLGRDAQNEQQDADRPNEPARVLALDLRRLRKLQRQESAQSNHSANQFIDLFEHLGSGPGQPSRGQNVFDRCLLLA
jgi:hypothetical protein